MSAVSTVRRGTDGELHMSGQNYSIFGHASCYECGICPRRVPFMLLYNAYLPASRQLLVRDVGPCFSRSICSIVRLLYIVWGAGNQRCHVVLVAIAYTTRGKMIFSCARTMSSPRKAIVFLTRSTMWDGCLFHSYSVAFSCAANHLTEYLRLKRQHIQVPKVGAFVSRCRSRS